MAKNRLKVNLISSLLSFVISTGLSFVLTPYLVNNLGKEIYSFYGMANQIVNYITTVSAALNSMTSKYIMVEYVRGNNEKAKQYFVSTFFANVILCTVLTPFLVCIVLKLDVIFRVTSDYFGQVQTLFSLVFAAMIVRLITSVYGSATYATDRIDLRSYTEISKTVLRLALYLILFLLFKPSIVFVGFVVLLLETFNSAVSIVLSKKLMPQMQIKTEYFNRKLIYQTLKVGTWNSVNHMGDSLLSSTDLMIANMAISESAGGNISIIKTLPSLTSGVITSINGVFMPRITKAYAKGDKTKLIEELNLAQMIMGTFITPVVLMLAIFGTDFFDLWVPGNDSVLLNRLSIIEISRMLFIAVVWPVNNLNIVLDKIKIPSIVMISGGVLNVLSMILLINLTSWGIYVIPLTTLVITILFYGVFLPVYSNKITAIPLIKIYMPMIKMMFAAAAIFVCVFPLYKTVTISNWLHLFLYGGLCGILALSLSFVVFFGDKFFKKYILRKK